MTIDLQWLDAMTTARWEFTRAERDAGWPQAMKPNQLAALQRPYASDNRMGRAAAVALKNWLVAACLAGSIDHTTTTRRIPTRPAVQVTPDRSWDGGQTGLFFPNARIGYMRPAEFKEVTERHITAPAFAAWLAAQPQKPSEHIAAWFTAVGVNTQPEAAHLLTATPAPVVDGDAPVKQVNIMKKAALIAELEYEWSSIEADISDATRNGLKAAAHTGKHGEWDKDKAQAWAVSKGKIRRDAPVHSLSAAWPGPVTRNTIGD